MKCELAVVPDCPSAGVAEDRFRSALEHARASAAEVEVVVIDDEKAAIERGFVGSPSFFVDGQDLFPTPGATPAVACRTYRRPDGGAVGVPEESELLAAILASTH